jgi:hypothetical protein
VGRPDEALGHDRIAFVVDLEASAVHEPGPGALDDPAFGQRFELAGVDAFDHFDTDVMVPAVLEYVRECLTRSLASTETDDG